MPPLRTKVRVKKEKPKRKQAFPKTAAKATGESAAVGTEDPRIEESAEVSPLLEAVLHLQSPRAAETPRSLPVAAPSLPPPAQQFSRSNIQRALDNTFLRLKKGIKRKKRYEGFDSTLDPGLVYFSCDDQYSPCWSVVSLYARMGLDRYNLLEGKNLELIRVKRFNKTTYAAASAFFITLAAWNPATKSLLTFQTKVNERTLSQFILNCYIACPRGESSQEGALERPYYPMDILPKCPQEDPFIRNGNSFYYVLKKTELLQHYDQIRLYLELAVAAGHRRMGRNLDLSGLKVVKVAIESIGKDEPPNERWLNAVNAIVYIRYKDFCGARVGGKIDRIAIVRRTFNAHRGCFTIDGLNQSSEIIPKKKRKKWSDCGVASARRPRAI